MKPGDETFRTRPQDAAVAPSGWVTLPSGLECTREPLIDATSGTPGLYARLSQADAGPACAAVGGRLPTREEVIEILDASHLFPPVLLPADHLMASRRRCEEHDATTRTMMRDGVKASPAWPATPPWDGDRPLGNTTKRRIHVPGMNPSMDEAICGWRKRDGSLWQQGVGVIKAHHGPGAAVRVDYGTGVVAVRDAAGISMPPNPPKSEPPGDPRMRSTIRLGSRGADVGVLQRILGVTADEVFGPATAAALRAWQTAHGLHADGVAGPQVWRAAGEIPAAPPVHVGAAPACTRALRDASAAWPDRKRASDGIMGDASHVAAGTSSHNAGNAVDITHDPASGCDGNVIALAARRDRRTVYVIWDAKIWNRRIDPPDGPGRPYQGSNPHRHHVHIDVDPMLRGDSSPWPWAAG